MMPFFFNAPGTTPLFQPHGGRSHLFIIGMMLLIGLWNPVQAFENSPVQGVHQDIQSEMEEEEPRILPQVQILWRAVLERNPTLQLAIQKMAEKTGEIKPKDKANWTQGMLRSLIQVGGLGGSVMAGNAAPLVGSAVLSRMTAPNQAPKSLTTVTSADLVILAREIEQAQSQLILTYLQYRHAQQALEKQQTALEELEHQMQRLAQFSSPSTDILHTLMMEQQLKLQQAQTAVQTYRNLLVLSAGETAVAEVDKLIHNSTSTLEEQRQGPPNDTKTIPSQKSQG